MTRPIAVAACLAAMLGMLAGCEDPAPVRRSNFLQTNPWVVKKDRGQFAAN